MASKKSMSEIDFCITFLMFKFSNMFRQNSIETYIWTKI